MFPGIDPWKKDTLLPTLQLENNPKKRKEKGCRKPVLSVWSLELGLDD